jgi:hypothetical protein
MNDRILRTALWIDSAACGAMGLSFALGSPALDGALGIPSGWLAGLGVFLIAWAGGLGWLAARSRIPTAFAWTVVAGNTAWLLASVAAVAFGWWPLTTAGTAVVIAQAVAVVALIEAEYVGIRRAGDRADLAVVV